jgi:hypothetical protein
LHSEVRLIFLGIKTVPVLLEIQSTDYQGIHDASAATLVSTAEDK